MLRCLLNSGVVQNKACFGREIVHFLRIRGRSQSQKQQILPYPQCISFISVGKVSFLPIHITVNALDENNKVGQQLWRTFPLKYAYSCYVTDDHMSCNQLAAKLSCLKYSLVVLDNCFSYLVELVTQAS